MSFATFNNWYASQGPGWLCSGFFSRLPLLCVRGGTVNVSSTGVGGVTFPASVSLPNTARLVVLPGSRATFLGGSFSGPQLTAIGQANLTISSPTQFLARVVVQSDSSMFINNADIDPACDFQGIGAIRLRGCNVNQGVTFASSQLALGTALSSAQRLRCDLTSSFLCTVIDQNSTLPLSLFPLESLIIQPNAYVTISQNGPLSVNSLQLNAPAGISLSANIPGEAKVDINAPYVVFQLASNPLALSRYDAPATSTLLTPLLTRTFRLCVACQCDDQRAWIWCLERGRSSGCEQQHSAVGSFLDFDQ